MTGVSTPIVAGIEQSLEWLLGPDGKRHPGERNGTLYTILMQNSGCAQLRVRTPELEPAVAPEEVEAACLTGRFVRLRFENFHATPYQGKAGLAISATADKAEVAPEQQDSIL